MDIPKFNEAAARGPRKTGAKSPVITRRTLQSSLGRRAVRPRIRANAACEPPIAFVATRAPARDGTRCVAPEGRLLPYPALDGSLADEPSRAQCGNQHQRSARFPVSRADLCGSLALGRPQRTDQPGHSPARDHGDDTMAGSAAFPTNETFSESDWHDRPKGVAPDRPTGLFRLCSLTEATGPAARPEAARARPKCQRRDDALCSRVSAGGTRCRW